MELVDLFPTAVGVTKLGRDLTAEESKFLLGQEFVRDEINSKNHYVLEDPSVSRIKLFIMKSADDYLNSVYRPTRPVKLRMTQSWTNKLSRHRTHPPHCHSNSFISGVFYIKAMKEVDRITFINMVQKSLIPDIRESSKYNNYYWEIPVDTGMLLFFPSTLFHAVNPLKHEGPRISLSFNLFPASSMGNEDSLTYLNF